MLTPIMQTIDYRGGDRGVPHKLVCYLQVSAVILLPIRFSNIFEKINADHFEGADEKFAVKSGGVKEFDPLRDGPLRYLGYSNECGCALVPLLHLGQAGDMKFCRIFYSNFWRTFRLYL